jgi:MFS family permease
MPLDHDRRTPDNEDPTAAGADTTGWPWYKGLSRYAWFVFVVASLGWLFDTMDQQLFNLARPPAMTELLRGSAADLGLRSSLGIGETNLEGLPPTTQEEYRTGYKAIVGFYGGQATSIFMIGWAIGGIALGILGDKIGRARTMLITVLMYSCFTGLSALSQGFWDFAFYRFLTGLGVGGQFAVGVAMVAEVMPDRSRPRALGMLQALSAVGNMLAGAIGIVLPALQHAGYLTDAWRAMFIVGLAPAVLAIPIMARLREPETWKKAARAEDADANADSKKLGSLRELFSDPRWRRNTLAGMTLAFAGVVGLWGIGVFSSDLVQRVFDRHFAALGFEGQALAAKKSTWAAVNLILFNFGAFFGIYAFSRVTTHLGRKPTFAIFFILALISTAFTFYTLNQFWHLFVLTPIMGFCQLALFGGYAIYFPELFPTRLRSTGTSFCYNVGRLVAAAGPAIQGVLTGQVFVGYPEPMRYAGMVMCSAFLVGLLALPFLPETKGQPLPE